MIGVNDNDNSKVSDNDKDNDNENDDDDDVDDKGGDSQCDYYILKLGEHIYTSKHFTTTYPPTPAVRLTHG